jgi:hypothetical protein
LPSSEDFIQAIENEASDESQIQPTNQAAAESLPHRNLTRDEALELLQGVFGAQLQAPAGIFDELEVEKFLAPNVAVVVGDQPPTPATATPQLEAKLSRGQEEPEPAPMDEKEELRAQSPSAGEESDDGPPVPSGESGQLQGTMLLDSSIPLGVESATGETGSRRPQP